MYLYLYCILYPSPYVSPLSEFLVLSVVDSGRLLFVNSLESWESSVRREKGPARRKLLQGMDTLYCAHTDLQIHMPKIQPARITLNVLIFTQ